MGQVRTYLEYNDPLRITWRAGNEDDPYPNQIETLRIINNRIVLHEIPSKFDKVKIAGYTEVPDEIYRKNRLLAEQEFYVNYSNGIVQFNPSQEDRTVVAEYKGRGIIQYPAERIYAHNKKKDDVVENLQDIIDDAQSRIDSVTETIINATTVLVDMREATIVTNIATDNANRARDDVYVAIGDMNDEVDVAILEMEQRTDTAITDTNNAAQDARNAYNSSINIHKAPVQNFMDIYSTYTNPKNGWRVMVESTGDIYRYDAVNTPVGWRFIENWTGGSVPYATTTVGGLMPMDDYNFIHDKLNRKTVVMFIGAIGSVGIQRPIIQFPFAGKLIKATAFVNTIGQFEETEISMEKISAGDFETGGIWNPILNPNLLIDINKNKAPDGTTFLNDVVEANDYFRMNIVRADLTIKGLTVQLDIQINS